jgi:WD40 repeat protein
MLKDFTAHEDHIHIVEWVSDTVVLSGCESGQLLAHDLRTLTPTWSLDLTDQHQHSGICALFRNPGTDLAIVGHSSGSISLLDLRTRRVLQSYQCHESDVRSVTMWSEPSSHTSGGRNEIFALTTSFDGTGVVWQLRPSPGRGNPFELHQTAKLIGHKDKILCCAHSRLTHDIFTSSADGTVLCWNPSQENASHGDQQGSRSRASSQQSRRK